MGADYWRSRSRAVVELSFNRLPLNIYTLAVGALLDALAAGFTPKDMRPYYFEHIPGNGIAIRLRKALSRAVKHSDSRLLIELSAADSSGSFCTFSSRSVAF